MNEYKILTYDMVLDKLKNIVELGKKNNISIKKIDNNYKTRLGFDIDHYSIGNGNKHIVILAGTHGSEIISVDFVIKLMEKIVKKEDEFSDFNQEEVTLDIFPIHNKEGYIISTSAIKTLIKDGVSEAEMEKLCKEYYLNYRQDDINARNNLNDHESLKLHQIMFKDADFNCIDEKYSLLKEKFKYLEETYKFPKGSMVTWRSNGSGVELNRNTPFNGNNLNKKEYGSLRYNNILKNIPGPIGTYTYNKNHFEFEPENEYILNFINYLFENNMYCGFLSFHSTYGMIYSKPSYEADESILDEEKRYMIESINQYLSEEYEKYTEYSVIDNPDFEGTDELLRVLYPGVLLIELSKMGGNPIGPYGDRKNYEKVINDNMKATSKIIKEMPKIYDFLNMKKILLKK